MCNIVDNQTLVSVVNELDHAVHVSVYYVFEEVEGLWVFLLPDNVECFVVVVGWIFEVGGIQVFGG